MIRMKKNSRLFITLLIAAIIIFFLGFVLYSVSSIPFQDPEFVAASIFEKQARDILVGKIVMLIGAALLFLALCRVKTQPGEKGALT